MVKTLSSEIIHSFQFKGEKEVLIMKYVLRISFISASSILLPKHHSLLIYPLMKTPFSVDGCDSVCFRKHQVYIQTCWQTGSHPGRRGNDRAELICQDNWRVGGPMGRAGFNCQVGSRR